MYDILINVAYAINHTYFLIFDRKLLFLKKLLTSTKYSDILIYVAYAASIIKFSLSGKEKRS